MEKHLQKCIFAQILCKIRLFDYIREAKDGKGYIVNIMNETLYLFTLHKLKVPKPCSENLSVLDQY